MGGEPKALDSKVARGGGALGVLGLGQRGQQCGWVLRSIFWKKLRRTWTERKRAELRVVLVF